MDSFMPPIFDISSALLMVSFFLLACSVFDFSGVLARLWRELCIVIFEGMFGSREFELLLFILAPYSFLKTNPWLLVPKVGENFYTLPLRSNCLNSFELVFRLGERLCGIDGYVAPLSWCAADSHFTGGLPIVCTNSFSFLNKKVESLSPSASF